jgi:hypothetical protein
LTPNVVEIAPSSAGQTCHADADCAFALRCVAQACANVAPPAPTLLVLEGWHFFLGLVTMGGPGIAVASPNFYPKSESIGGAFVGALRGGVLHDLDEIGIEFSPGWFVLGTDLTTTRAVGRGYANSGDPVFQLNGTYRHLVSLRHGGSAPHVYWPIGGGVGFLYETNSQTTLFQARADLVGLAFHGHHLLVDLQLPSVRYAVGQAFVDAPTGTESKRCMVRGIVEPCALSTTQAFIWFFGVNLSYVF